MTPRSDPTTRENLCNGTANVTSVQAIRLEEAGLSPSCVQETINRRFCGGLRISINHLKTAIKMTCKTSVILSQLQTMANAENNCRAK